jgi:hypothetical protein
MAVPGHYPKRTSVRPWHQHAASPEKIRLIPVRSGCGPEEVAAVIDVRVENGQLRVRLTGWDALSFCWRPSWSYEVPVSKVVRVYVRPARPAVGARSATRWGPRAPELRRIRGRRPSLWVDLSRDRYQRLAFSAADAEELATTISMAGRPITVRHGQPGPLTPDDVARLAAGELARGD